MIGCKGQSVSEARTGNQLTAIILQSLLASPAESVGRFKKRSWMKRLFLLQHVSRREERKKKMELIIGVYSSKQLDTLSPGEGDDKEMLCLLGPKDRVEFWLDHMLVVVMMEVCSDISIR
jgi:hypothetical protein